MYLIFPTNLVTRTGVCRMRAISRPKFPCDNFWWSVGSYYVSINRKWVFLEDTASTGCGWPPEPAKIIFSSSSMLNGWVASKIEEAPGEWSIQGCGSDHTIGGITCNSSHWYTMHASLPYRKSTLKNCSWGNFGNVSRGILRSWIEEYLLGLLHASASYHCLLN